MKRFFLRALVALFVVAAMPSWGAAIDSFNDLSGTITTGGTSQTLAAANPGRRSIHITHSTAATEVLCVNVTSAANCTGSGTYVIAAGGFLCLNTKELVTVVAATTGHKFTAKEGAEDCPVLSNGGSTSISGATDGVAQGSTTSGQSGVLVQGAVTTSAPSYTNAQTSPLSLDTSGNLRVNVVAGGAGGGNVTGGTAHDAVGTSVNPVLVGGYASAAAPTNVSADGDAVRAWLLRSGATAVQPTLGGVLASAGSGANGTGVQRVTIATDDTIVASLATKLDTLHTDITAANSQLPSALGQTTMSGSLSVALASNQSAVALHGHGATGAAVPANVTAMGARAGANSVNVAQGSNTVAVNVSTATTTQLVALSGSTQIYVTGLAVIAGGTGNITLVYGTGSACGTGTTSLSGAIPLIANAGFTLGSGLGPVVVVPAGQALCITTSAAVQMSGFVTYTQF
ncbi:MAG: hypothetical protein RLZZ182_539 [Pseudomonadota bacterium]|jgi:hypothetical protein